MVVNPVSCRVIQTDALAKTPDHFAVMLDDFSTLRTQRLNLARPPRGFPCI